MTDSHKVYWASVYITPQTFVDIETTSATPRLGTFSPFFVLPINFFVLPNIFIVSGFYDSSLNPSFFLTLAY